MVFMINFDCTSSKSIENCPCACNAQLYVMNKQYPATLITYVGLGIPNINAPATTQIELLLPIQCPWFQAILCVGIYNVILTCSESLVVCLLHFQDILAQIQVNPANKVCADCSATDPSWGVINRGVMVCINCSGA